MPDEQNKEPETTPVSGETPAPEQTPTPEPIGKPVTPMTKKSLKTPLIIALAAVLLLGGGAYAYTQYFADKDDDKAAPAQTSDNSTPDKAETASEIPDGYKLFSDALISVSFLYPESWGEPTLTQGEEERMDHLTSGSQKIITFSNNNKVVAGVASVDWTHDPDMGHGGVGEPGVKSLADAKKVKDYIKATNVLVDSDTQFAYVTYCADNCSDEAKLQLQFTTSISGNDTYAVIQFYQDGDALNTDFYTDGLVDYEALDAADLSLLFPKTDSRFIEIQKVANSVKSL